MFLLLLFECILLSSLSLAGLNHSIDGLPVLHVVQLNCYTCDVTKKDMAKMEHHAVVARIVLHSYLSCFSSFIFFNTLMNISLSKKTETFT